MSTNIERVRYYEGEYLRSADFIAEQKYHVEMRRRMNLALHLSGIVDGLDIEEDAPVPGVPTVRYHVTAGMAIDAYGREILLPYAFPLDDELLLIHRISQAASYSLWIAYDLEQGTPAEARLRNCHTQDHNTRWHESYRIIISNDLEPAGDIAFTGTLRDDSEPPIRRVRLGTVNVSSPAGKLTIATAVAEARTYVGLRAQRITTPTARPLPPASSTTETKVLLSANPPATPPLSLGIEADLVAEKDLIVGDNFIIERGKINPPQPDPLTFPKANGNIKIAGDFFLGGNLYARRANNEWLGLKELIESLMPDIFIDEVTIPVVASPQPIGQVSTVEKVIKLETRFLVPRLAKMIVSISDVSWLSLSDDAVWVTNVGPSSVVPLVMGVSVSSTHADTKYDFTVKVRVGPTASAAPELRVTSLTVSYVAIFLP